MNNIETLNAKYLNSKNESSQHDLKIREKTQELSDVKQKITSLNERVAEVDRLLSNAAKGVGEILSSDEFVSLKKESEENKTTLSGLKDFLNIQNNMLTGMRGDRSYSSTMKGMKKQLAEAMVDQKVNEIAKDLPNKLQELMHLILAQGEFRLSNSENYDILCKKVGEKLIKQVFTNEQNSILELPTIHQAIAEHDALIEKLA